MKKKVGVKRKAALFFLVLLLSLIVGSVYYVNDYYHSDKSAENYLNGDDLVTVSEIKEGLFFDGRGNDRALIFYPGAKVEYTAYAPVLNAVAQNGIDCFLVKMPCNLAIFGMDKASTILDQYNYKHWYLGGHSLGGAMAASYAGENPDRIEGIILWAAYPTKKLDSEKLKALTIYGSEDKILNREKLEDGRDYMPQNYTEVCIDGGNHAWFGAYGAQDGDGKAVISHKEQWEQTVDAILNFVTFD